MKKQKPWRWMRGRGGASLFLLGFLSFFLELVIKKKKKKKKKNAEIKAPSTDTR
jgi:hypothetical protein